MGNCARVEQILSCAGNELTREDEAAISEHLKECPECRREMQQISRAAHLLSEHTDGQLPQQADHLSDLSLACFAISGYRAPDADDSVAHLAACPTCRHELAAVRETMEYSQEILGEGPCHPLSVQEVLLQQLHMAFSTVPGTVYAISSGVVYIAECVMFALALAHVWLAYLVAPVGFEAVPNMF
ncbi:MAG: zf-HC2 domain-containing protein, partial [Armatimonadota bacterium]